jgi:hypothetical protein
MTNRPSRAVGSPFGRGIRSGNSGLAGMIRRSPSCAAILVSVAPWLRRLWRNHGSRTIGQIGTRRASAGGGGHGRHTFLSWPDGLSSLQRAEAGRQNTSKETLPPSSYAGCLSDAAGSMCGRFSSAWLYERSVSATARTSTLSASAKDRKTKAGSAKENLRRKVRFLMFASCSHMRTHLSC